MCVASHCSFVFKNLLGWIQDSPTLDLIKDYSRFVITFFDLISTSASHIYISALPLSPQTSMVRETYKQYERPLARVVHGLETSWRPVVATIYDKGFCSTAAWSSCNRFVAVALRSGVVEIRDAGTLYTLNSFKSLDSRPICLSFSPDSRFLTQFNDNDLITWDVQTGGSAVTIFPEGLAVVRRQFSSAYSMNGDILAAVYLGGSNENANAIIATHHLSTTRAHLYPVSEGRLLSPIWTHGNFLRFATVKPGCIIIWEAEFTLTPPPKAVESFPAPDEITNAHRFTELLFLPTLYRLAICLRETVLIWDARDSKPLLRIPSPRSSGMSHSPPMVAFLHIFS